VLGISTRVVIAAGCAVGLFAGAPGAGATPLQSGSGHGTLDNGARQFSFNANLKGDGTVTGQAELVNMAYTGANGTSPYRLHIDISCMHVVGNIAVFGGSTKSTNDPGLVDAVFFSVQDNGEPGKDNDKISRAYFWDDDPTTTGDPQACLLTGPNDFPLETIEAGNIQVRPLPTT
jgi:hypothetical protein